MQVKDPVLAHELDAAWIIALWKTIHGGDPSPEAVAAQVIAVLAPYLTAAQPATSFSQLEAQFANLGIHILDRSNAEDFPAAVPDSLDQLPFRRTRQYCFQFGHQTICAQLPEAAYRDTAA